MANDRRTEALRLEFAKLYGTEPTRWFRAPGRVDLMGSHTDYNDGWVATMTVDRDTWLAIRPRADRRVRIATLNLSGSADFSLDAVEADPEVPWTDYVRGAAKVLSDEGVALAGFDGLLHSTVPFGSGLSSSAAIESVVLLAFAAVSGVEIGLTALNPVQPEVVDHAWLHREFDGRLAFYGVVSTQTVLPSGTPEEVKAAARRCVAELAPNHTGLVLAPSHRMMSDVSMENLEALMEAMREIC